MLIAKPLIFYEMQEDGTFKALAQNEINLGRFSVNEGLTKTIQIHNPNKDPPLIADLTDLHTGNSNSSFHSSSSIGPSETITATIKVLSSDIVTLDNMNTDNMTTYDSLEGKVEFSKE